MSDTEKLNLQMAQRNKDLIGIIENARDWFTEIMERAKGCPSSEEEFRYGLCKHNISEVIDGCKFALEQCYSDDIESEAEDD